MITKKFTLIEVLVAMGIFVVGISPLMGVLTATARNSQRDMQKTNLSRLANMKIQEYKMMATITPSSFNSCGNYSIYPGVGYCQSANVIINNGFDTAYSIELTVGVGINSDNTVSDTIMYSPNLTYFNYIHVVE